jgi:hypothetical protein
MTSSEGVGLDLGLVALQIKLYIDTFPMDRNKGSNDTNANDPTITATADTLSPFQDCVCVCIRG